MNRAINSSVAVMFIYEPTSYVRSDGKDDMEKYNLFSFKAHNHLEIFLGTMD